VQDQPFDIGRAKMKDARFAVIDPDDRVIVVNAHG
jgi:hypothetical protein